MHSAKTFIMNENRILLLYQPTQNAYDIPGGSIETDETPERAVIREAHEETGFMLDSIVGPLYEGSFRHPREDRTITCKYFLGNTIQEEPKLSEHSKYLWTPPQQALSHNLLDSIREALEYCESNKLLYQETP